MQLIVILLMFLLIGIFGVGAVVYLEILDVRYHKEIRDILRKIKDRNKR